MRVFITRKIPDIAEEMLRNAGHTVEVSKKDRVLSKRELMRILRKGSYEALVCLLTDTIDAEVLASAPTVRIVANYAVGFNNIDIAEAARRGVVVANTPGVLTDTVAEHTIALLLAIATRVVEGDTLIRKGKFEGWGPLMLLGTDLKDKTLGILGAGRIGERVMHIAVRGFGMKGLYYDIHPNEALEKEYGAVFVKTPEELLPQADVVSVHVPLLPETTHLMDARRLALMKKSAYLINTSRGPVIDEAALAEALQSGVIRGAALDVFEKEPKVHSKLRKLSNVVLTPHTASATDTTRSAMARLAAQAVIDFGAGKEVQNKVVPK